MNEILDHTKLYDSGKDFYRLLGHAVMQLTRAAAIEAINLGIEKILFFRIEGGRHSKGSFQPDTEAIWDSILDFYTNEDQVFRSNRDAINFIKCAKEEYNAFILTCSTRNRDVKKIRKSICSSPSRDPTA